jgi:hypothetical protein
MTEPIFDEAAYVLVAPVPAVAPAPDVDVSALRSQYSAVQDFFATHHYDDWAFVRCHWCLDDEKPLTETRVGHERTGDRLFCSTDCQQMYQALVDTYPKPQEATMEVLSTVDRRRKAKNKARRSEQRLKSRSEDDGWET